ncbi:hypothetical protein EBR21_05335, partial [bacterium]|nr:hypothetical protein [bacterium]
MKFKSCGGQALVELVVFLPLLLALLSTPVWFKNLLSQHLQAESKALDDQLQHFWGALQLENSRLKAARCLEPVLPAALIDAAPWPEEVDQQRATSLAGLRGSCLAEATAKLGPKVALPLWGLHLGAPSEAIAKSTAGMLCPKTKSWSERLRSQVIAGQRLLRIAEQTKAENISIFLKTKCTGGVNSLPPLDRLFSPILGPTPRWRFSSVG